MTFKVDYTERKRKVQQEIDLADTMKIPTMRYISIENGIIMLLKSLLSHTDRRNEGKSRNILAAIEKEDEIFLGDKGRKYEIRFSVTGLKDLTINVPAMVRSGDTVILTCTYDLEGSSLYSIQWSLEEVEFYRYVTERMPPQSAYNVSGIHVNRYAKLLKTQLSNTKT
ncbi:hypothetical protein HZH68_007444 [Vespula germanica]|uniref:Uncharacterized protein n=1 Tax=Vespula germanica TaxID=30212 RepID=A0A834KB35_VESGE|nr:hypothetical protein HZH68_007444 [Vespula germanica]